MLYPKRVSRSETGGQWACLRCGSGHKTTGLRSDVFRARYVQKVSSALSARYHKLAAIISFLARFDGAGDRLLLSEFQPCIVQEVRSCHQCTSQSSAMHQDRRLPRDCQKWSAAGQFQSLRRAKLLSRRIFLEHRRPLARSTAAGSLL